MSPLDDGVARFIGGIERRRFAATRDLQDDAMTLETALYLAQLARCFHCGGFMRWDARGAKARITREHLVPAPYRQYVPGSADAIVLAHGLCNTMRDQAPTTAAEAARARLVWRAARELFLRHGREDSPFGAWLAACDAVVLERVQRCMAIEARLQVVRHRLWARSDGAASRVRRLAGAEPRPGGAT